MIVTPDRAAGFASLASLLRPTPPSAATVTASPLLLPVLDAHATLEGMTRDASGPSDERSRSGAQAQSGAGCDAPDEEIVLVDDPVPMSDSLLAEIRCFRTKLDEALTAATARLAAGLAADVLGRELAVTPADIERVAQRLLAEYWDATPLRIRVSPHDAIELDGIPVVIDPSLRSGDCAIDLADGTYESTLGVRLAAVLDDACLH